MAALTNGMMARRLALAINQPALPAYRVPVFRELSQRLGTPVRVFCSGASGIARARPDGFSVEDVELYAARVHRSHRLLWDVGQCRAALADDVEVATFCWDLHYLSLAPSLLAARARGRGTVLWGHGCSKNEKAPFRRARDAIAKLADAVLFYDANTASAFSARTGHPGVFVAPNALDHFSFEQAKEHWSGREDEIGSFLQKHGVRRPFFLFVSRALPENRVEVLLRALRILAEAGREIDLVLIGVGPHLEHLQRESSLLGLGERVHFLGAIYEEIELAPWFLSALAFCYPSNIGLSLHHAFGYGLPVVVGDDRQLHNPEIHAFRHERNGLFFRHGDAGALAQQLARLIEDEGLRRKLSSGAKETATEFSLEQMVDGFEAAVRYARARRG